MNYSEIVTAVLAYSDRTGDAEATANIDTFIRVAESRLNRVLRVGGMETRASISTVADQSYYLLPDDFGGIRDIELRAEVGGTTSATLLYASPEQMNNYRATGDIVGYYTIIANQLQINPMSDGFTLEVIYYRRIPNLTLTAPTNWLSNLHPDIYIMAVLVEISTFTKDADAIMVFSGRFDDALAAIINSDSIDRWSGTSLQIRAG